MLPFKLVYSDKYHLPIGAHVFPAEKYRMIHERLLKTGVASDGDFAEPSPATDDDVRLAHTSDYVAKLLDGTLGAQEEALLELPYSKQLVDAFWLAAGGSILAGVLALKERVAFNIGGGFHHAYPGHGEGFCMVHDVAVAIKVLQRDKKIGRAMTVDCDVHHGNGTAAIFPPLRGSGAALPSGAPIILPSAREQREAGAGRTRLEQTVFTISLHQQNNYPAVKPPSSIDVNLPDGTNDEEYLKWLDNALSSGLRQFKPDLICYIAGADPYKDDQLGGLSLTMDGLKQRDKLVFEVCKSRGIPVMVTYAGGYARQVEDTVTIHCNTVVAAKEVFSI
jgi:acetoin utilization deacetylase AcuC-like enzyme